MKTMMIRSLMIAAALVPCSLAAKEAEPKKVGWVETVDRDIEGWKVSVDVALLPGGTAADEGAAVLKMLANHLQRIAILLPEEPLAKMRTCGIRIEHRHPELAPMQYHPDSDWLVSRGYDPALAKKVHIPRAADLLSRGQMLKHPAVILHELAHAYHDQILNFDEPEIMKAYRSAMDKGIYDKVLLYTGQQVKHYATTDQKEYFAESTEAYLYRNDFYPFVAAELKQHDPAMYAIMEKVWGKL
jgi:dipeptidyl-peptidase-4